MFPSLAQLRNLCGGRPARRGRPSPVRSRKARLQIEALEERAVPTVVFMPHFGAETLAAGSTNDGMQHPTVNVVF